MDLGEPDALGTTIKRLRLEKGWTQQKLADEATVGIDSIVRLEAGHYPLPTRARTSGLAIEHIARALGINVCQLVVNCFDPEEIKRSAFSHCLKESRNPIDGRSQMAGSLAEYVKALPTARQPLARYGAQSNAQAIALLIALEAEYAAFEYLLTNQPPFFLFADDVYITQGSVSVELSESDRELYHELIYKHRAEMRRSVVTGEKHYKVVLHQPSLITFLNSRGYVRARAITDDMLHYLRYEGLDLVLVDAPVPLGEAEILSSAYPYGPGEGSISVHHRRVGVGNTVIFQLAIMGTDSRLIEEDYRQAENLWNIGIRQMETVPAEYAESGRGVYATRQKRIVSVFLEEALRIAHPEGATSPGRSEAR